MGQERPKSRECHTATQRALKILPFPSRKKISRVTSIKYFNAVSLVVYKIYYLRKKRPQVMSKFSYFIKESGQSRSFLQYFSAEWSILKSFPTNLSKAMYLNSRGMIMTGWTILRQNRFFFKKNMFRHFKDLLCRSEKKCFFLE